MVRMVPSWLVDSVSAADFGAGMLNGLVKPSQSTIRLSLGEKTCTE